MKTGVVALAVSLLLLGVYIAYKLHSRKEALDTPLISIVGLLKSTRQLSLAEVSAAATDAFGVTFDPGNPTATQFVIPFEIPLERAPIKGLAPHNAKNYMVKVNQGVFMVNSFAMPYMSRSDAAVEAIADQRLRSAISSHRAWISVDAMGQIDMTGRGEAYRAIGKMVAALLSHLGDDCLAIYAPELQRCNEYDTALLDKLRSADPLSLFSEPTFAPVIRVESDDPRMQKAVSEARRRWPEFVTAFKSDASKSAPYIVKAEFREGDKAEFMWVSVTAIDAETIHGVLENEPHELTELKKGQTVAVSIPHLNDWLYAERGKPIGGFTLEAIREAQQQ